MSKTAVKYGKNIWGYVVTLVVVVAIIVALIVIFGNKKSGDVEYSDNIKVTGLKCTDVRLKHFIFEDYTPISFENAITASFQNDKLSSITYNYIGIYRDAEEAKHARDFSLADYGLTLNRKYDTPSTIFSHNFSLEEKRLYVNITADAKDISSKYASFFMLDASSTFPTTLSAMSKAYEAKGFTCQKTE